MQTTRLTPPQTPYGQRDPLEHQVGFRAVPHGDVITELDAALPRPACPQQLTVVRTVGEQRFLRNSRETLPGQAGQLLVVGMPRPREGERVL